MGGDPFTPPASLSEEESLMDEEDLLFQHASSGDEEEEEGLTPKVENGSEVSVGSELKYGEFRDIGNRISSIREVTEERQNCRIYDAVLKSYEDLPSRIDRLEEAKQKVLSYTPGSLVENSGDLRKVDHYVPKTTSLLLIGPKDSGKSSLVNKISRVLEDDMFCSERAQVSCKRSSGDGTYFLHEYKIPRGSGSFCLYDTRSLSRDPDENKKMIKDWMTNGVRHGELVKRKSDSIQLKARMKCKARGRCSIARARTVNFVIFVVNGISVLESMDSDDETKEHYYQLISSTFNNPLLSFKDDKPVVVVTHGDLLSVSDRVRVRVFLGELLGISPTRQIYDIPAVVESDDAATTLAIVDMLTYSLERSDRNLPGKYIMPKGVDLQFLIFGLLMLLIGMIALIGAIYRTRPSGTCQPPPQTDLLTVKVDWHSIRHMWLGSDE